MAWSNLFGGILDQIKGMKDKQGTQPGGIFGSSKSGKKAGGLVPSYLQGATGAGGGMGDFFAKAFQSLGDKRQLNAQLGTIGQQVAGRARKARTSGKFKGSPIGEALASGVETGGASLEQQARLRDEAQKMRTGMGLSQAFTGAVTSPLLSVLGMSLGDEQSRKALAEQSRQFDEAQPSDLDKALGFVGGLFCWVARATLRDDRWLAARAFLLREGSHYLQGLYTKHGEELAEKVDRDPALREELLPVFEEFAKRGKKYLE